MTVCWRFDLVSTVGDSPVTVIVSASCPTSSLALTVAVNAALIAMSARSIVLKPCSSNFNEYAPGGSRSKRYVPLVSVVTVCTPPIKRSPERDTSTPGMMALLRSVTVPKYEPVWTCALAPDATSRKVEQSNTRRSIVMVILTKVPTKHNNLLSDDTCQSLPRQGVRDEYRKRWDKMARW